ncbi:MAG: hypothetical protein APR62_07540 [Smithella sp. SDB]|nr:MAG: hypothetical protein APR62_07540 [Smithella sp. SDB]
MEKLWKLIRWSLAVGFFLFGMFVVRSDSWEWSTLRIIFFSIPLAMQFTSSKNLQIYSLWWGLFLVLQIFLSQVLLYSDFKTLTPNFRQIINVKAGIPGISGNQLITTDSKGFRTTKNVNYESSETFRIFAIGGSTTEQIHLDDKSTWTHLLQEQLSKRLNLDVEVINAGVAGTRAKNHLATLHHILKLHPDMVIFLFGLNDWNWYILEAYSKVNQFRKIKAYRANFLLEDTLLGKSITNVFMYTKNLMKKKKMDSVRDDFGLCYSRQRGSLNRKEVFYFHPEDVHPEYKKLVRSISNVCHDNNIACLFVTQPSGYKNGASDEFKKGFWMTPPGEPYTCDFESMIYIASLYNSFLLKFSKENDHPVCDAASMVSPTFDNFYDDCHFNTNGAKNLSRIIADCVVESYKNDNLPGK